MLIWAMLLMLAVFQRSSTDDREVKLDKEEKKGYDVLL